MSPKKLSDSDKQDIIQLYRTSNETTSTLAERYGVSSSTISRFLKNSLSESEYENLIQQKRLIARTSDKDEPPKPLVLAQDILASGKKSSPTQLELPEIENPQPQPLPISRESFPNLEEDEENQEDEEDGNLVLSLNEMLGEDLEDLDEEDEEEEDWETDELETKQPVFPHHDHVEILPFSEAYLPKVCYVVIDRCAELITRPLQEFADLGSIPVTETQQTTLPIFDNQKVARRFSNRSQRVIKVPDGRLFRKTSSYLKAKGITRLLIDGQVYALSSF